jgi:hypothetical protein
MPNIENLRTNSESKFNRKPSTLDREQLEYSAQKMLTYGVILFAVVLGLGSVTYMTVQQLKK